MMSPGREVFVMLLQGSMQVEDCTVWRPELVDDCIAPTSVCIHDLRQQHDTYTMSTLKPSLRGMCADVANKCWHSM